MLIIVRFDSDWSNPEFVDMMKLRSCARESIKAFKKRDILLGLERHYKIYKNIWDSEKQFIREYNEGNII